MRLSVAMLWNTWIYLCVCISHIQIHIVGHTSFTCHTCTNTATSSTQDPHSCVHVYVWMCVCAWVLVRMNEGPVCLTLLYSCMCDDAPRHTRFHNLGTCNMTCRHTRETSLFPVYTLHIYMYIYIYICIYIYVCIHVYIYTHFGDMPHTRETWLFPVYILHIFYVYICRYVYIYIFTHNLGTCRIHVRLTVSCLHSTYVYVYRYIYMCIYIYLHTIWGHASCTWVFDKFLCGVHGTTH